MADLRIKETGLTVFENPEFGRVRVVERDGEPWFVAKDVLRALGYAEDYNPSRALQAVPEEWKGVQRVHTLGGTQDMLALSEQGLYFFLGRSDKPKALPYQKWLAGEFLPAIRKHGMYATPYTIENMLANPDVIIEALQALKEERKQRAALEEQAALDRPKVVFAESIETSKSSILIGELAKLIRQATGADIGQNRLFGYLRNNGYLHCTGSSYNLPTQRSMEAGLMEIKEGTRIGSNGESIITKTTKITGKGQIYFINLFKRRAGVLSCMD